MNLPSHSSLEERMLRLEDESAIMRVLYKYVHAIDYGDEAAWVDCFTEDGAWRAAIPGTDSGMVYQGREALNEFAVGHTRPPELYHKHIITAPIVDIDGDSATSQCYFHLMVRVADGLPTLITFGRYTDKFVRCADGQWRIAERRAEPEAWNPIWTDLRNIRRDRMAAAANG